jgi:aspartate 1-decarboxylase
MPVKMQLLSSKLHKARITECLLDYEGSLAIDLDLMDKVGLLPYERILVVNITNGQRLETYAIPGPRGQRGFCLNGAAARRGATGDRITIMAFRWFSEEEAARHQPRIAILNEANVIEQTKGPVA